jgi:translation initiation factor 2B subunit (eIF-2B alpha/beta/delta family)
MRDDIQRRIAQVRDDREHGSRWLVREALLILRDLARTKMASSDEHMRQLFVVARELAGSRPAMAALSSAVSHVLNVTGGPEAVAHEADRLLEEYEKAPARIASYAEHYLQGCLMTCSVSGTVLDVLAACRSQIGHIIALEGRPRYEGRVMAQELQQHGFVVTVITDAQADIFLPQCRAVVVGADSVLANGDVLNKAGTALLGWAARGHQIPFYVLCETLKISPRRWIPDPAQWQENLHMLEEKEGSEVWDQAPPGITVRNFYFDRTPAALVSAWITEGGVLDRAMIADVAAQVEKDEQHLARG